MHLIEAYLSFEGRLARIPFFVRSMYLGIVFGVLLVPSVMLISAGGLLWYAGVALIGFMIVLVLVSQVSLIVRRLHDMGLSGYHAIWIGAAEVLTTALSYGNDMAVLMSLPFLLVSLWLVFWPGRPDVATA
ncbi:MAG: DUF805 domain-containing protein [Variibacter sp.]|nr:DUF805 domain-containing protein [Variibacter sp.]